MEGTTLASILSSVGTLVTQAISWMSQYLTAITSNDVLVLFCIALPIVGLGIGVIKRLVRIRA